MFQDMAENPIAIDLARHCPEAVAATALFRHVKPQEQILVQGERPPYFCLLLEGHLKAYHTSSMGSRYLVLIHNPGDVMGEIEIQEGRPCICTVEALTSSVILCLSRDAYLQWLKEDPHFGMFIHKKLCDKVYLMAKKSAEGILFPLKYRLLNLLKYLAETDGAAGSAIRVQKEFLGEELGVTLRSVNRMLRELKDKGILDYQQGTLSITSYSLFNKEIDSF